MKFTCEKSLLLNACTTAARAAAAKSPIPALEGLLLRADASGVCVTGYNLKKGIYTRVAATVQIAGTTVVTSRFFGDLLRRLPDGIVTFVSDDRETINVRCGKSSFDFMGISSEDFPEMPEIDPVNTISIPQNTLRSMISQTLFAVSDNDSRPIYTGSLFEIEDDQLTIVSVDGYRLAKRVEKLENCELENCSFVVPGTALNDIEKLCSDTDEPVRIYVGERHISFAINSTVLLTRRLEGDFLNYRKAIPEVFKTEITAVRSEMISTVDRVSLIISEKNSNPIRMKFGDGTVNCVCITPIGKADDTFLCEGNGNNLEIGFNDRYVMDALKAAGTEKIKICLNTSSSPCVITAADGSQAFTYMVLPVRLRSGE